MFTRILLGIGFGIALSACGGGNGSSPDNHIDRSRLITSLNDGERQELCASNITALGGEGKQYHCSINGQSFDATVQSVEVCESSLKSVTNCDVTVGELDDCTTAQSANFCIPGEACTKIESRLAGCQASSHS
jgi:hypothetical protein